MGDIFARLDEVTRELHRMQALAVERDIAALVDQGTPLERIVVEKWYRIEGTTLTLSHLVRIVGQGEPGSICIDRGEVKR